MVAKNTKPTCSDPVIKQLLQSLSSIPNFQHDMIYQQHFFHGKIISIPNYRIVEAITTTEPLITTLASTDSAETYLLTSRQAEVSSQSITTEMTSHSEESTPVQISTFSTTTPLLLDWEHVNELDEQENNMDSKLTVPIVASIVGALIAVGYIIMGHFIII